MKKLFVCCAFVSALSICDVTAVFDSGIEEAVDTGWIFDSMERTSLPSANTATVGKPLTPPLKI